MTTEHECIWVLHGYLHSMYHFSGLALEKSAAATDENRVTSKNAPLYVLCLLISAILNLELISSAVVNLAKIQNVAPGMTGRVETSYFYLANLEYLFIFHW